MDKNIVSGRIVTDGPVIVGDSNVINILKEAAQYKEFQRKLDDLARRFEITKAKSSKYPDDEDFKSELLEISKEQEEVRKDIELLKQQVIKLADEFSRIPIDTERLRLAKEYFEAGEFDKARGILDAEQLTNELDYLLHNKQHLETKLAENTRDLKNKSSEFLILARLTSIDFSLPDRFELAVSYFEKSLAAEKNFSNTLNFAHFLHIHRALVQALPYFEDAVILGRALAANEPGHLQDLSYALQGLSTLYADVKEMHKSLESIKEAIQIREQLPNNSVEQQASLANCYANISRVYTETSKLSLARGFLDKGMDIYNHLDEKSQSDYAYEMVILLQNSAALYRNDGEFDKAKHFFDQALTRAASFGRSHANLFVPLICRIRINLAETLRLENNNEKARESCEIALNALRVLAEENPYTYLPEVGAAVGLLAQICTAEIDIERAKSLYNEALQIFKGLARQHPRGYVHVVGNLLNNLGSLHLQLHEDGLAKPLFLEAVEISRELAASNPEAHLKELCIPLYNLAVVYKRENNLAKAKEFYEESLLVIRQLAKESPDIFNITLATTLTGLANLALVDKDLLPDAENLYQEALDITQRLAVRNPEAFLPRVAMTASNFCRFYHKSKPDKAKSLALAKLTLKHALPAIERVPTLEVYIENVYEVIAEWGEDAESITIEALQSS